MIAIAVVVVLGAIGAATPKKKGKAATGPASTATIESTLTTSASTTTQQATTQARPSTKPSARPTTTPTTRPTTKSSAPPTTRPKHLLISADQIFEAVKRAGVPLRDNPVVPGYNDQGACVDFRLSGTVRENRRLQIPISTNPDDDLDLVVFGMRDESSAKKMLKERVKQTADLVKRGVADPPFAYYNVVVEIQVGKAPTATRNLIRSAVESIHVSATDLPPALTCPQS